MAEAIPLRNLWLLFLYAADLVQFRDQFRHEVEAARDLPDLVARILVHVVEARLRRNLSRGYQPRLAQLSRVRGRIDMLETQSRRLMDRARVACRFEEHTMNTPRNRLVRAAIARLGTRVSDDLVAHRCRQLAGDFSRMGVDGIRPSWAELSRDQIARNESGDHFMVALSRMVFDIVIPTEEAGQIIGTSPQANDHLIRKLFEKAIGNALRLSLDPQDWQITQGRRLYWPHSAASDGLAAILPSMQSDIELNHKPSRRRIIIDTKFNAILTASNYRQEILRSHHVYQLYAYLRSQENDHDPNSLTAEGMLLHPQTGTAIDEEMQLQGHRMRFMTIDLMSAASDFEDRLKTLI